MKFEQTIVVAGKDLLVVLRSGEHIIGRRVWANASQYIQEREADGTMVLRVPAKAELNVVTQ